MTSNQGTDNAITASRQSSDINSTGMGASNPPTVIKVSALALTTLAFLAWVYTIYYAQALLFPISLALLFYYVLRPIVRVAKRYKIPRYLSAFLLVGSLLGAVGFAATRLAQPAADWIDQAPGVVEGLRNKLGFIQGPMAQIEKASNQMEALSHGSDEPDLKVEIEETPLSTRVFSLTSTVGVGAFLTIVLLFFMLGSGDGLTIRFARAFPKDRQMQIQEVSRSIEHNVSTYLLTYTIINCGLGLLIGFGMWSLGLPNPVLWGVMAALLNYVPFVGAVVGSAVVFVVGLVTFGEIWPAMLPPLLYITCNSLEGYLITPMILGRWMSLHPLMILLSVVFWGWIWGVGGALLAVPFLAVMKIIFDNTPSLKQWGRVLS